MIYPSFRLLLLGLGVATATAAPGTSTTPAANVPTASELPDISIDIPAVVLPYTPLPDIKNITLPNFFISLKDGKPHVTIGLPDLPNPPGLPDIIIPNLVINLPGKPMIPTPAIFKPTPQAKPRLPRRDAVPVMEPVRLPGVVVRLPEGHSPDVPVAHDIDSEISTPHKVKLPDSIEIDFRTMAIGKREVDVMNAMKRDVKVDLSKIKIDLDLAKALGLDLGNLGSVSGDLPKIPMGALKKLGMNPGKIDVDLSNLKLEVDGGNIDLDLPNVDVGLPRVDNKN